MIPLLIIGALAGSFITWLVCKHYYDRRVARYLGDTLEAVEYSRDLQNRFYATHAMLYVSALRALESGQTEHAKGYLAVGAAGFYSQFGYPAQSSQWIEHQKRAIELLAKTSPVLRAELDKNLTASEPTQRQSAPPP